MVFQSLTRTAPLVAMWMITPALAAPSVETAPVEAVLERSAKAPLPSFTREVQNILRASTKEPQAIKDSFSAQTRQWTVHSIDGRAPTAKEIADHKKQNDLENVPGFHKLHSLLTRTPDKQTVSNGRSVYHWNSLPKGAVKTPGGDISAQLSAQATLAGTEDRPYFSDVRIYAAKPFRVKVVAQIKHFNVVSHYAQGENGLPYLTSQTTDTDVSAPLGMGGKRKSTIRFTPASH